MTADVPGHGTTTDIRNRWLNLCAPCDTGMPAACTCPTGDPRALIAALCDALDQAGPAICPRCGLPDPHQGQGDGIGSCDCPRCDCCTAGPDACDCGQDWNGDPNEPIDDYLCNDRACPYRAARTSAHHATAEETHRA